MKYLSTFTGIGGFELGINKAYGYNYSDQAEEQVRINETSLRCEGNISVPVSIDGNGRRICPICIGYSEINKYADQIYQSKFPEHKNYGDITKINEKELPDFDLFVGGFPCQAFSIAGKRGGFEDTRGTLFFDCARIINEKRPRHFILENVKGLLSHDGGNTFKTIITSLTKLGYCVEWQVLNAKNFGVPQNRERVFIVGHLGGIPKRKVFPIRESNESSIKQTKEFSEQISNTLRTNYSSGFSNETYKLEGTKIRRLTPLECERLMGYPDGWTEGLSDTQRYKTLGNGIVSNVVAEVVKKLYLWE